ncbi:Uncharacterized mitochondrial protein AtMg00300, partial [Striga hermonthica]
KEEYARWKKADEMAKCYILACLSNVLQHQHQSMNTAADMLLNLKELFGHQSRAARQEAMRVLMNMTMREGTPVREHVLAMMAQLNELEVLWAFIDGETQVDIVLQSLPKSFEQFWLNYNMNKMLMTLSELVAELHFWCVDTWATDHVCNSLQGFQETKRLREGEVTIYLGDASRASAVAVGDVYLDFGLDRFLVLKDCLYVPSFRKNFISISKLFMNGFSATFDNKVVIRFGKKFICSGSVVDNLYILESKSSPLQQKQLLNSSSNLNKRKEPSKMNETYLWHLRLGHINLRRIQRLVADGPLGSLEVEAFPTCESCLEGKMTKRVFSSKGHRAKDVLGIVHSDLCGPMSIQARDGFEYFQRRAREHDEDRRREGYEHEEEFDQRSQASTYRERPEPDKPRFVMSIFTGSDPEAWLNRIAQYFELNETEGHDRVRYAAFYLDGEANVWWQWLSRIYRRRQQVITWTNFERELLTRFGTSDYHNYNEALTRIRQTGNLHEYIK